MLTLPAAITQNRGLAGRINILPPAAVIPRSSWGRSSHRSIMSRLLRSGCPGLRSITRLLRRPDGWSIVLVALPCPLDGDVHGSRANAIAVFRLGSGQTRSLVLRLQTPLPSGIFSRIDSG